MNIYVGNLAWKTKRKELKELFENFGEVINAFIVRDKKSRRSRGFGFVEMSEDDDARIAIEKLNNTVFLDRTIIVNEAREKDEEYKDDNIDYDEESPADEMEGASDSTDTSSVLANETPDETDKPSEVISKSSLPLKNPLNLSENTLDTSTRPLGSGVDENDLQNN